MSTLSHYEDSLALLTDLYQLTMGYGYWKQGMHQRGAVFHLTFRKTPFGGQYAVACGTQTAVDYLASLRFREDDCDFLRTLTGNNGEPLFDSGYIDFLAKMQFHCDVDIVPEGAVVFPHEPLVRVRGPLLQAQLIETPLLNLVNFQTLAATKASRVCRAARGGSVLEFGLRRAQGVDGGLAATRGAYVGGCAATSNVLAGKRYGIPVRGTHAHSWVMAFEDELESFRAYAEAMPNNSLFLVDTYDTADGVRNAITAGRELEARGHRMAGIRLDSGDLGELSLLARRLLDEAGFEDAVIVASSDLDEHAIERLMKNDAAITVWGVGTKLATCYDQPALGGVYKLSAIETGDGGWRPTIKLSEQPIKISNPTAQQVRRFVDDGRMAGDMIYEADAPPDDATVVLPGGESMTMAGESEELLVAGLREGQPVSSPEPLEAARERCQRQLRQLPEAVLQSADGDPYPVGLHRSLHELKQRLIQQARQDLGRRGK